MKDILRALCNVRAFAAAVLVAAGWLCVEPVADKFMAIYRTEQARAQASETAYEVRQTAKAAQDRCQLQAGESIPIFDAAANFMGCRPRRTR